MSIQLAVSQFKVNMAALCLLQVSVSGGGPGPVQPIRAARQWSGMAPEKRTGLHQPESDGRVRQNTRDRYNTPTAFTRRFTKCK